MTGSNVEHRRRIKFIESGRRSVAGFANEACNLYRGKVIRKDIYPYFYGLPGVKRWTCDARVAMALTLRSCPWPTSKGESAWIHGLACVVKWLGRGGRV